MSANNEEDVLRLLEGLERVEAPPFLMTRTQQKISERLSEQVSPVVAWSAGFAVVLLLLVNTWVLTSKQSTPEVAPNSSTNSMFFPNNSLYE